MTTLQSSDASFLNKLEFTKLSSQFVGREKERQQLKAILDYYFFVQPKPSLKGQIVFVHGESGIGKSALILHLQHYYSYLMQQRHKIGYFVSGKVDQYQKATKPYGVFVDAITDLCQQVLLEDAAAVDEIKKDLFEALGHETTTLTNLIPALLYLLEKPNQNNNNNVDTNNNDNDNQSVISNDSLLPNNQDGAANQPNHDATMTKTAEQQSSTTNLIATSMTTSSSGFSFQIFIFKFRWFLRAFCKPTRPLILFLDDLQWADDGTRKLITAIAADDLQENILIVGAYRDNDAATYEFDAKDNTSYCMSVTDITLGPLSKSDLSEIISTITGISSTSNNNNNINNDNQVDKLSEIVLQKTGGNAFFALQYLEALYRAQLIFYDFGKSRWNWNTNQIEKSTCVSDNIVGLLIGKLQTLDPNLQHVLMFAACLGFTFDLKILHGILISEQKLPMTETKSNDDSYSLLLDWLTQLTKEGLIHLFNTQKYQFAHDRVQQSAYALFPQGKEGDAIHVRVGQQILKHYNTTMHNDETWMLFRAVDLLTPQQTYEQQQQDESKLELIQLYIQAANKAIEQTAFLPAAKYVSTGIDLLDPSTMWDNHYDIALELYNLHAKMQFACGNYSNCFNTIAIILDKAHTVQDKLPAYVLRASVKGMTLQLNEVIAEAIATLKIFGMNLPKYPTIFHLLLEYIKMQRALKKRTPNDLLQQLPTMKDPIKIEKMHLLMRIALNCNEIEQFVLMYIVGFKLIRMTLKYGLSRNGMYALAGLGMINLEKGQTTVAMEYSTLVKELLKRPEIKSGYPSAIHVIYGYLDHFKNPLQDSIVPLLEGYRVGMEHCEVEYSVLCLLDHLCLCATLGMPLDNLERQLQSYCALFKEFGQEQTLGYALPYYQYTLNLAGKSSNPLVLTGHAMNETELLQNLQQRQHHLGITFLRHVRMMVRYIFGAYDSADLDRQYIDKVIGADSHFIRYFSFFYCGLTCLAMARKKAKKYYIKAAKSHIAKITKYVKDGSVNGAPMLKLLQAEIMSLQQQHDDCDKVKNAYQTAIQFNRRCGFRIFTGIALERAGEYHSFLGDKSTAQEYIKDAYLEFEDICAFGKCKLLQEKYPWLQTDESQTMNESDSNISTNNNKKPSSHTSKKMQPNVLNSLKDRDLKKDYAESSVSKPDSSSGATHHSIF